MRRLKKDTCIMLGVLAAIVLATTVAVYIPQKRRLEDTRAQIASQKALLQGNAERAAILPEVADDAMQSAL